LLLVRDRLGIKPVYWCRANGTLLFGSEIKAILASDLVEPVTNRAVLPEVLSTRYTSGTDTLFQNIHKLLPGHLLVFEGGNIKTRQYWICLRATTRRNVGAELAPPRADQGRPYVDAVAQFRSLLEESVRLRLMSDVPLGMFLSGASTAARSPRSWRA